MTLSHLSRLALRAEEDATHSSSPSDVMWVARTRMPGGMESRTVLPVAAPETAEVDEGSCVLERCGSGRLDLHCLPEQFDAFGSSLDQPSCAQSGPQGAGSAEAPDDL